MRWPWKNDGSEAKLNLREPAMQIAIACFALAVSAQGAFWWHSRAIMPEMTVVPDVPGERTVRALSFGDEEAFFRFLSLNIQNSGDTFGRFTALYKYDFNKLYQWFRVLTKLNDRSDYLPSMATYYFSQTQNPKDVRYMIDFLDEYTDGRVKEKWWWVVQGVYLAQHKLKDSTRALQLSQRLAGQRDIPIWAQQMPAFVHEARGEFGDALAIIQEILKHEDDYSKGELNFMRYFVDERLGRLDQVKKELDKIAAEKALKPDVEKSAGPPPGVGPLAVPGGV